MNHNYLRRYYIMRNYHYICDMYKDIDNIKEIQKYNIQYRNNIIEKVKKIQGVTQKQIARVLGINIRIIQRASNKSGIQ